MTLPEYCFVCFHDPSVHGLISGDLHPCPCCESPAAVDAHEQLTLDYDEPRSER